MTINFKHWLELDYWTFEEAASLFTGITPTKPSRDDLFQNYQNHLSSNSPTIRMKMEIYQRFLNSDWSNIDSKARKNRKTTPFNFLKFSFEKDFEIDQVLIEELSPEFLSAVKHDLGKNIFNLLLIELDPEQSIEDHSKPDITLERKNDNKIQPDSINNDASSPGHLGSDLVDAFDPLPTSTIADMFPLVKGDSEENLRKWKSLAAKASENGLDSARIDIRKGTSESTFNPVSVADWMIQKKGLSPEKAVIKLKNSLPYRSKDNCEDLFSLYQIDHPKF